MSVWLAASCALVAGAGVAAGLLLVRQGVSRTSGALLAGSGIVGLFSTWLLVGQASRGEAAAGFILGGLVIFPGALWAYPRPRYRHPIDFVLGVLLVAPGVALVLTPHQDPGVIASMVTLTGLVLIAQTWWRLETAQGPDRRALLWSSLALGCAVLFLLTVTFFVGQPDGPVQAVAVAPLAAVPVALAIGVLRPELVEVRGLVVNAVVFSVLALGYIAAFVGVVSLAELLGAAQLTPAALAVVGLLAALALHPAELGLRGVIDQLLFGDRPDPLDAATKVVARMSDDSATALRHIREDLALPYVCLVRDGQPVASSGSPVPHTRRLVVTSDGVVVEFVVGLRPGDLRLPDGDARVLSLVGPLLVQILRAEQLTTDLQASRGQAIAGIAEERRRLRRELHDGLGPALTGIAFCLDAACNTLPTDPSTAQGLLVAARADTAQAIAQIRGLVYGMRPPALDELGLGPALRQQAAGLRRADGEALPVDFQLAAPLPVLPAAVEVAAYRIVIEALTNTARHALGGTATVVLSTVDGEDLDILVTDDAGPRPAWTAGVGITSMRERAAEVGGTLTAGPTPQGGRVHAVLPTSLGPATTVPATSSNASRRRAEHGGIR